MNIKDFFTSLKAKWEAAIIITVLAATFGLYINFFLPHYYQSHTEFLIVQRQNPNIDAYTAIKGAEQLAYTFKQIVLSPAFFEKISEPVFDVETSYFGQEPKKIIKKWQKTAIVETVPNTGILKIDVFHSDQREAQKINQAISYVISNERHLFLGDNQEINVMSLGKATVSNKNVKPNALVNTLLGVITGIVLSASLIIFLPNKKMFVSYAKKSALEPVTKSRKKRQIIKEQAEIIELTRKASAPSNLPII